MNYNFKIFPIPFHVTILLLFDFLFQLDLPPNIYDTIDPMLRSAIEQLPVATHLFEDTPVDWVAPENYYEDTMRRHRIDEKIADSGADIVALQEVWAERWQQWFTQGTFDDQSMQSSAYNT